MLPNNYGVSHTDKTGTCAGEEVIINLYKPNVFTYWIWILLKGYLLQRLNLNLNFIEKISFAKITWYKKNNTVSEYIKYINNLYHVKFVLLDVEQTNELFTAHKNLL